MKIIDDNLAVLENHLLSVESQLYRWNEERKAALNQIELLKMLKQKQESEEKQEK